MLNYIHARRPKVHLFAAQDTALCGATGNLRFTMTRAQVTCKRCEDRAAKGGESA